MKEWSHEDVTDLACAAVDFMRNYKSIAIRVFGVDVGWEIFMKTFYLSCMDAKVIAAEAEAFRRYIDEL